MFAFQAFQAVSFPQLHTSDPVTSTDPNQLLIAGLLRLLRLLRLSTLFTLLANLNYTPRLRYTHEDQIHYTL